MLKKLEFQSLNGAEEIEHASAYHQIRLFTVARYASEKPVAELEEEYILQQWAVASKGIVGKTLEKTNKRFFHM